MTHKEFTKLMMEKTSLSSIEIAELQAACSDLIIQQVAQGNTVVFSGFGTFEQKEKPERKMYNPTTKEFKTIPARQTLGFRPSNTFKEKLNATEP
jgi:nucleoid DNA-binding protein